MSERYAAVATAITYSCLFGFYILGVVHLTHTTDADHLTVALTGFTTLVVTVLGVIKGFSAAGQVDKVAEQVKNCNQHLANVRRDLHTGLDLIMPEDSDIKRRLAEHLDRIIPPEPRKPGDKP